MSNTSDSNNLEQVIATRNELVRRLNSIVATMENHETSDSNISGKLELETAIADLKNCSDKLRTDVFRLLVLGDVKRGKSTVINALIGEDLLPRDINACTAILTVLRYGIEKRVTVYFNDNTSPEILDLETFKQKYSLSPDETKNLEEDGKLAFPHVKQAVIEYPASLLELGIEIVDSPGLNDTAARNQLSLDYIYNCHAILFVLRAVQPFSLAERRYLNNYIKDRGLDIFFLINGWDEIDNSLLEPGNDEELSAARERSQEYFRSNLTPYLITQKSDSESDIYDRRVFPISALNALRSYSDNATIDIESTGFNLFTDSLNIFLREERNKTEFQQVAIIAKQAYARLHEAIERRIPLLSENRANIKQKVDNTTPDFVRLQELQYELQEEIKQQGKVQARKIATSFESYILKLETTFEVDFYEYQPQLDTWGFLSSTKREDFNLAFKQGFDRYLTDKLAEWDRMAKKDLDKAVLELVTSLESYSDAYQAITDSINLKIVSDTAIYLSKQSEIEESDWKNWTIGCIALASGNVGSIVLAGAGVNWRQSLINWLSVIGISRFIALFTGVFLNPYSILLVSLGLAGVQTSFARQEFIKLTQKEFVKYLPAIAQEQKQLIESRVIEAFEKYERTITKRIDRDIKERKAELANLLEREKISDSDRTTEIKRLQDLDNAVLNTYQEIESIVNT